MIGENNEKINNNKAQAAMTPAASLCNITEDRDGLKPQDDTATL